MRQKWLGYPVALGGIGIIVWTYNFFLTEINVTTVALSFLLVVLTTASLYGLGPSITASIIGMLCFNFFFLPPVGKFSIHDPQNWVALFTFTFTAIIASHLSSAAQIRATEAERRREEIFKLYELSRAIIIIPDSETAIAQLTSQITKIFEVEFCALFTLDESNKWHQLNSISEHSRFTKFIPFQSIVEDVFKTGENKLITEFNSKEKQIAAYIPLKVGIKPIGVMVLISIIFDQTLLEAIASLIALAFERAKFLKQLSYTEALRQSNSLKSAILDSVSHDLRTPLTSIRAAVENLLNREINWDNETLHEFHLIISEEVNRLTRLVHNLLEMARIESGALHIIKEWESVLEIFDTVLDRCATTLQNHKIQINLAESLPLVKIDPRLIAEVVLNLIENAAKYSFQNSEIILSAEIITGNLRVSVINSGYGILPDEIEQVFDKFYRGLKYSQLCKDGTGMGLAIAKGIIEAHGGKIWAESIPNHKTTFKFTIPVEYKN